MKIQNHHNKNPNIFALYVFDGLVTLGGYCSRDEISMQFASRDFRPSWVAVKLPLASPRQLGLSHPILD